MNFHIMWKKLVYEKTQEIRRRKLRRAACSDDPFFQRVIFLEDFLL
ncbi:hypothetical protein CHCC14814_2248 [Bacillus paralicheniformis]|nr:hypothetical protein CHCC14814_2248 [Bacillus paralicheniformis]